MASTIVTKNSSTASAVPVTGDLTQGELAVNVTDKRLFTKNSGGTVVELGTNPASLALPNGTANGVAYLNGSKVVTTGSALTFDGTNFATTGSGTLKNLLLSGGTLPGAGNPSISLRSSDNVIYHQSGSANNIVMLDSAQNTMQSIGATAQTWNISNSEQMRLTSTGLGIGTSSPGTKLHVTGSNGLFVQFLNSANNTGEGLVFGSGSNLGRMSTNGANTAMAFEINAVERMRLDSSGNLGLGVTPSAWNAGSPVIQMAGGTSIYADSNQTVYGLNAAYISGWKYVLSDYATQYNQVNGQHQWYIAPSGTAGNAITFTQAMTLDASGNLLLGTTSPIFSSANRGNMTIGGSASSILFLGTGSTTGGYVFFEQATGGMELWNGANGYTRFGTNNTERARIDSSGNLLVGKTSLSDSTNGIQLRADGAYILGATSSDSECLMLNRNTSDGSIALFKRSNTQVGSISVTTTATAYNTSSDYRLKNIDGPLNGSGDFIDALKPKVGTWKSDGSKFVGFLAHEVQEVSPQTVVGEKDAVDEEGKPIMQAMEYGSAEFIANIVAELQSLRQRVAQLEGK